MPARWQRVAFLKWLKRVHAWTGFWGALLFLGFGVSGFLLNHRTLLRIDTGVPQEVSRLDMRVAPERLRDAAALDAWSTAVLGVPDDGYSPVPESGNTVAFLGKHLPEAERLTRIYTLVDGSVTVDTVPGSNVVTITHDRGGILAILQNMHKGLGLNVAWVLLIDTIAGALVTMSLTGLLLWSRLHGARIAAIGLLLTSLLWALAASVPDMTF